jgi:hypothetical protein
VTAIPVDAVCKSAQGGRGIIEGGVHATAFEEALAASVAERPDDLGIVEGVEDIDWHDTGSSRSTCAAGDGHAHSRGEDTFSAELDDVAGVGKPGFACHVDFGEPFAHAGA